MNSTNELSLAPANPYDAWFGTILVFLIVASPELLAFRNNSPEPGYLLGQATMKLLVSAVLCGLLVCRRRPFHFWFNWVTLGLGVFFSFLLK